MEKHYPTNGDFPELEADSKSFSKNILFKTRSGRYCIGYCWGTDSWFYADNHDDGWPNEEIECWWYLPE